MQIFWLILLLLSLFSQTHSKLIIKKFDHSDINSQSKSLFLTKFSFGPNGGTIRIHVKYILHNASRDQASVLNEQLIIIDSVLQSSHKQYALAGTCESRKDHMLRRDKFSLAEGGFSQFRTLVYQPMGQQHIHYIYWAKCESQLSAAAHNQKQSIEFEVTMFNDGSHFGQDEKMLSGYVVLVVVWLAMIVRFALPMGRTIMGSSDKTKITVFTGLVILGFAYFYRLMHFFIYYANGEGIYFFQVLYFLLKTPCEFIIVTLIVAIGWGWSITHLSYDQSYIVAGVAAAIINTICLIVSGSAEEMVDVHHKYDSTAGNILLLLRIFILLIFATGVLRIYNREPASIRKFIKKLGAVGGLYLASWPLTVILAETLLPSYMHNQVITFVEQITHLLATWMLCSMLAHPESAYRKISIKDEDDPLRMQNYKMK